MWTPFRPGECPLRIGVYLWKVKNSQECFKFVCGWGHDLVSSQGEQLPVLQIVTEALEEFLNHFLSNQKLA